MKKTLALLGALCIFLSVLPLAAQADIGPKPSVVIDFKDLQGERYFATLLARVTSTGPHSVLVDDGNPPRYTPEDTDYDIFKKFVDYEDEDGFHFLQFMQDCSETGQLAWTYYPPREFKVLLYLPATDEFVASPEIYERYAFDSYFTAAFTGNSVTADPQASSALELEKSYNYGSELSSLLIRILLTLAIELAIALLFGLTDKKLFRFIMIVNLITQIGLNVALNVINYFSGQLAFLAFYALLELLIFIVEAMLYTRYLRRHPALRIPAWKPIVYALVANGTSFFLGLRLALWLPQLF